MLKQPQYKQGHVYRAAVMTLASIQAHLWRNMAVTSSRGRTTQLHYQL